ncbi:MAG: hypothetical protein ACXVAX_12095, partial [Pseudobdellovibrio sp.]
MHYNYWFVEQRLIEMHNRHCATSVLFVLVAAMSPLKAAAFESAGSNWYIGSTYSGHEEITRQALANVAGQIKDLDSTDKIFEISDLNFNLQPEPRGLFGYKSQNMVIHGNFSTDFPGQTNVFDLAAYWNNPQIGKFENADSQVLHFLRNYKDSVTLDSAYNTCMQARENIKKVTLSALNYWENNDRVKALFLIGHALHTIQDSFSPAHTRRAGDDNNNDLQKVCFFGGQIYRKMNLSDKHVRNELCYHSAPDSRDAVWNVDRDQYKEALAKWKSENATQCDKNQNYPETEDAKRSCLKNEARLARSASEKYLFLVFSQIASQQYIKLDDSQFIASLDS